MSRRLSVAQHEEFLAGLMREKDFDEIDELAADPISDRAPRRSEAAQRRLDAIFSEIEAEGRPA